jgi:hypothetical protein
LNLANRLKIKLEKKFGKTKYGETWKEIDPEWYKKIHESNYLLHEDFKKFLKSKKDIKTLLEVGCGAGIYPINNKELFSKLEYTGTDFSNSVIEYCKKKSDFKFFQGDFIKLELTEKYDFVFSHAVVDHVYNIEQFITNLIKSTRKYAYINSYRGYFPNLENHKMQWDGHEGCYFNELSIKKIEELLKKINLKDNQFVIRSQRSGQKEKNVDIQTVIEIDLTK